MTVTSLPPTTKPSSVRKRNKEANHSTNPIKAGWLTKVVLSVVCVLWILPVLGTFITSLRPLDDVANSGWWSVFFHPSRIAHFTLHNYHTAITAKSTWATP